MPPKMVLLQWIGEMLQVYEHQYEQCRKAIAEIEVFYNERGFKMMVLKGLPVRWIGDFISSDMIIRLIE